MGTKKRILRYWFFVVLYMALIFLVSSIPGGKLPDLKWEFADGIIHFFEYLVLGVFVARAIKISYPDSHPANLFIFAFLFSFLFAASDEIHQYFVPGRFCEIKDLISDGVGIIVGILTYGRVSWLK